MVETTRDVLDAMLCEAIDGRDDIQDAEDFGNFLTSIGITTQVHERDWTRCLSEDEMRRAYNCLLGYDRAYEALRSIGFEFDSSADGLVSFSEANEDPFIGVYSAINHEYNPAGDRFVVMYRDGRAGLDTIEACDTDEEMILVVSRMMARYIRESL